MLEPNACQQGDRLGPRHLQGGELSLRVQRRGCGPPQGRRPDLHVEVSRGDLHRAGGDLRPARATQAAAAGQSAGTGWWRTAPRPGRTGLPGQRGHPDLHPAGSSRGATESSSTSTTPSTPSSSARQRFASPTELIDRYDAFENFHNAKHRDCRPQRAPPPTTSKPVPGSPHGRQPSQATSRPTSPA